MQIDPYLVFDGRCEEAFKFYAELLGGKIEAMFTHGETPAAEHTAAEWHGKIVHARMAVGDQVLMASDAPPEHYQIPAGLTISITVKDPPEVDRIFNALSQGGTVQMPAQKTFWSQRFGMCTDRFGIPWMVNCEQPAEAK